MRATSYGVDIDEVLFELIPQFIDYHNEAYGTCLKLSEVTSQNLTNQFRITLQEIRTRLHSFYQSEKFRNIRLIPGAGKGILRLKRKGRIHLITSREEILRKATRDLITGKFPQDTFITLNFAKNQYLEDDRRRTKPEICMILGIEKRIEDSLEQAVACSKVVKLVYLFDLNGQYEWNHTTDELPKNVKRVFSWDEID